MWLETLRLGDRRRAFGERRPAALPSHFSALAGPDGVVVADADGVIGTFTEVVSGETTTTATLNNTGVVTFTDGSILLLPSIIFIPDN